MESQTLFTTAELLLPRNTDLSKWSVVACDQYTSQPEYWEKVGARVGDAPSTLHMIFPEVWLDKPDREKRISAINRAMEDTLKSGVLAPEGDAFVYVERTLGPGRIRRGLVGKLDLEAYEYGAGSCSPVRPTEGTVESRLPPRIEIRAHAPLELPHILVLVDDPEGTVLENLAGRSDLPQAYRFPLGENGGEIRGRLVRGEAAGQVTDALTALFADGGGLSIAVGDGNHSLATARACFEQLKKTVPENVWRNHPARWALVELVNIHDPALTFEPIHRLVTGADPGALLAFLEDACGAKQPDSPGETVVCVMGGREKPLRISTQGTVSGLAVERLQQALDRWLEEHRGTGAIDYIHGEDDVRELARRDNAVGLLLPAMEKSALFSTVRERGALPRKTFSLGEAWEKRYYLEARKIR